MDIFRTAIPMRRFKHAAAERKVSEAVVVAVHFDDGSVGWGETLPRKYVTGETIESVIADLKNVIWPRWAGQPMPGKDPLTEIAPAVHEGRYINAAICAFDLATTRRLFERVDEILPELLKPLGGRTQVRRELDVPVSGVLGLARRRHIRRRTRAMQWLGLEHFKLKISADESGSAAAVQAVCRRLGRSLEKGTTTLRVDVNGGWDAASAVTHITALKAWGVCAVEQPIVGSAEDLVELARRCPLPLIADESLVTERDARVLLAEPQKIWWNVRLCKNGGLAASLKIAQLGAGKGVTMVYGCMVGESSILSAAQRRFLQMGPGPRFVEGNYGRLLLKGDLTTKRLAFGYGGKLKTLPGDLLGVTVDLKRIQKYGKHVGSARA